MSIPPFSLDRAIVHSDADLAGAHPWRVSTPAGAWAYAVTLPADWGDWPRAQQNDGVIRLRLRVLEGEISVLATDAADSIVIDQVFLTSTDEPTDVELIAAPLGSCERVVIRNGARNATRAHLVVDSIDCRELGPADSGEELAAPLELRAIERWSDYYGSARLTPAERRRSARYSQLKRVMRMPWIEQLSVHLYPNDSLSRALYVSGLYEPSTMLVLRRLLRPGAVFVDVGANAGLFSMVASRWVETSGHVYSLEPSVREYARLIDHLALNALDNVTPIHSALGREEGASALRVARFPDAGLNTLGRMFAYPTVSSDRIETVTVTTLDSCVSKWGLERLDVVKLDIEGSEPAALAGASGVLTRFRPALIVEISAGALSAFGAVPRDVVKLLADADYRLYRIGPDAALIPASVELLQDENIVATPAERSHS